ncbi:MAG: response regulator transcription factor [Rhodospirillales bacterium]|nr:response regulator transcription factor [Rhodospirillales bacterium]
MSKALNSAPSIPSRTPRIVVVDDEKGFRDDFIDFLAHRGFEAHGVASGQALLDDLKQQPADLIILDVMLDGEDGRDVARKVRAQSDAGILMLTCLDEPMAQVSGLDAGADAYLAKGVDLAVVEATVRSLLRRLASAEGRLEGTEEGGVWHFDSLGWVLTAPNGRSVRLTFSEKSVLMCLLESSGTPVKRAQLTAALGKAESESALRNLDTYIRRLRKKVQDGTDMTLPIQTAYSLGYVFAATATVEPPVAG